MIRPAFTCGGLALAAWLMSATAAPAAFCAMYNNGSRACGIPTLEMCVQSVTGVGGTCQQDFTSAIPPNFAQRLRADSLSAQRAARPPRGGGSFAPQRPVQTSPCVSLSGDTCSSNYLH